jgi:hypothetical protein|nr:MAG TPA: replisome organizer [Caudoviricetes sp.]
MEGWIKVHRKLVDWEWYNDINVKVVFLHLLLTANHKEKQWKGQTILRGQKLTSIEHLADDVGLTIQQTRTALKKLKSTHEITIKTTNKNTLITIEKFNNYQFEIDEDNKQNNKQFNNLITNNQQTNNKQITTNKNEKNDNNDNIKKEKNKKRKTFEEVLAENNCSEELEITVRDFIDMRKTIKKPMTSKALELLFRNLEKLTNLEEEKIAILNQSIEHGWQTVYPLKTNNMRNSSKGEIKEEEKQEELKEIDISGLTPEEYDLLVKKKITIQDLIKKGRINV